jgi:hypothetical protein
LEKQLPRQGSAPRLPGGQLPRYFLFSFITASQQFLEGFLDPELFFFSASLFTQDFNTCQWPFFFFFPFGYKWSLLKVSEGKCKMEFGGPR